MQEYLQSISIFLENCLPFTLNQKQNKEDKVNKGEHSLKKAAPTTFNNRKTCISGISI